MSVGWSGIAFAVTAYATVVVRIASRLRGQAADSTIWQQSFGDGNLITMIVVMLHVLVLTALRDRFQALSQWGAALGSAALGPPCLLVAYHLPHTLSTGYFLKLVGFVVLSTAALYELIRIVTTRR